MHSATKLLSFLVVVFVFAGCAGTQPIAVERPPETPGEAVAPGAEASERVTSYAITPPAQFMAAVREDTRTAVGLPGDDYWQNDADYTLSAVVDPVDHELEGTGRIAYHNNSPDSLYTLHLELVQNLHAPGAMRNEVVEITGGVRLERVAIDGRELQTNEARGPSYVVNSTDLAIVPPHPIAPGETAEIEIDWSFEIPQQGASGRMGYSADNLNYLAYWYPIMQVYDDVEGWHTDPFLGRAEFYAGFGDYDVTLQAPANWIVWGTGTLQNPEETFTQAVWERVETAHESDIPMTVLSPRDFTGQVTQPGEDGLVTWMFEADRVRDFGFSVMRDYNWMAARTPVGDRDGDGDTDYTRINTFYRDPAPLWADVTRYQQHAITFLSDYTGLPYPWPHMTAVEGSGIIGGGMEYPMMTLMGDYNSAGPQALYNVTAHELAHMWIPMIVATNERHYSWLDEGTTTFHENQARADFFPGPNHERGDQQQYIAAARQGLEGEIIRRSDYQYSPAAFVVASYFKPSALLSALRGVLGVETFNEALQSFIQTWAFKHAYPYDFFNTFERVSGRDLDWFWRSGYYETWTLDQAVASVRTTGGATEIVVEDQGRVPMPVDLVITLANGETIERRIPVDIWLRGSDATSITLDTDSPVTRVEIDPALHFPDIDRSDNVWSN